MERSRKHTRIVALEIMLLMLFFVLWLGMVTGRIRKFPEALSGCHEKKGWEHNYHFAENAGKAFAQRLFFELVPSASGKTMADSEEVWVSTVKSLIQKEVFPIQSYSMDYWKDTGYYVSKYSDHVPEYFLESDETNEEPKKKDPGTMPTTGEGKTYSMDKLTDRDYLLNHFYVVDETTSMTEEETDAKKLLHTDLSLDLTKDEPLILIYHTHASENYKSEKGESSTVVDVGEALKKELEDTYHIPVIHDTSVYDMVNGELDRSLAYNYAADGVSKILKEHPGIQVILDLHRDSISEHHHLVTDIDGKKTAQIMFFNGVSRRKGRGDIEYLNNPNKISNLSFSLQMQLMAAKYYPGLTRKIYIKGYRYNLHLKKRAALIEVGAQNNTGTEAKHAMKPLAELLFRLLSGEKAVKEP